MPSMDYAEEPVRPSSNRGPPTPRQPGRMSGTSRVERYDMQSSRLPQFAAGASRRMRRTPALGLDFLSGYVWSDPACSASRRGQWSRRDQGLRSSRCCRPVRGRPRPPTQSRYSEARAWRPGGARATIPGTWRAEGCRGLRRGAAAVDITGRSLSAGLSALPWPDDERLQLWHACITCCAGTAATVIWLPASRLVSAVSGPSIQTERRVGQGLLAYTSTRAWSPEAMEQATARLTERGLLAGDPG